MALDVIPSKASGISHAHRVGPEHVLALGAERSQPSGRIFRPRAGAWIGGIREHAHKSVFRKRTGRPSIPAIGSESGMSRFVMYVGGIRTARPARSRPGAPPCRATTRLAVD